MATANLSITERYQQPIWGQMDPTLRNCLRGAGIFGLLVLVAVLVAPTLAPKPTTMEDVPERLVRLILKKAKPVAPTIKIPEQVTLDTPKVEPKPKAPPRRRAIKQKVAPDKGVQGRQKAQKEVTQNLAHVTGSLDKVLDDLSKSLPVSDKATESKKPRRRRRAVRSGRTSEQLSSVGDGASMSSLDVSKSAIVSDGVTIAAISDLAVQDGTGGGSPSSSGTNVGSTKSGHSELRSNESLLNVVRRYAPGIQFCYDNELRKNPGLRGKLVVSITVLASGTVSEALVLDNSLESAAVTNCVVSQIRGWQFPTIPAGTVSFKAPFVFKPPN